jgi:Tol biopolymer transport system component
MTVFIEVLVWRGRRICASTVSARLIDHHISGESRLDGWPAWSNDGKRVVFSRRVSDRFQVFVMNRDGSAVMQLTNAAGEFVNPRWSPDGTKIMCARRLGDVNLVIFPAPT